MTRDRDDWPALDDTPPRLAAVLPVGRLDDDRPLFVEVAGGVWLAADRIVALYPARTLPSGRDELGYVQLDDGSRYAMRPTADLADYLDELDPGTER